PQVYVIKQRLNEAQTQEDKREANKKLITTYKQYGINPLKGLIGCLPILIQFPILLGLIITLKFTSNVGIDRFPYFLWFDLIKLNLCLSFIASFIYFVQPLVNTIHYPKDQRKTHYLLMVFSPIFIMYISVHYFLILH